MTLSRNSSDFEQQIVRQPSTLNVFSWRMGLRGTVVYLSRWAMFDCEHKKADGLEGALQWAGILRY